MNNILKRFRGLLIFSAVTVTLILVASAFPIKQSFTKEQILTAATPAVETLSSTGLPPGFSFEDPPEVRVILVENGIQLFASFTGSAFGTNQTTIEFVTAGRPVYRGSGNTFGAVGRTVVTLYELATGNRTQKRVVFVFDQFNIVDETFIINGEPAIEFAVPSGQALVEGASQTSVGQAVTGVLERFGRDTSAEARDAWTADTMRQYQSVLLSWFENFVRNQINNQTLYVAGDSAQEQLVAATFGGFVIAPETVTLQFYVAAILALLISTVFGLLFGIGYWVKRVLYVGKDSGLVQLDDETIEKLGDVTQAADDIRRS